MRSSRPSSAQAGQLRRHTSGLAVESYNDVDSAATEWRAFQEKAAGGPHQTFEWASVWLSAHPARHAVEPVITILRDGGGNCVAILPFAIHRRFGCSILEWLGADQGNYSSGLFDPSYWSHAKAPDAERLLDCLLSALPPVDLVHLADHPVDLDGLPNPLAGLPGLASASDGYAFPLGPEWETQYKRRFSARYRKTLKRKERRLAEYGPVELSRVDDTAGRLATLETVFEQKRRWFAERGISDVFADADMRGFYRALVCLPQPDNGFSVRVYKLTVGDEIVAASVDLLTGGRYYGLIASTTSTQFRKYGPGNILFHRLAEQLAGEGVTKFDCGAGENEQKLRWCTERRLRRHAIVPVTETGRLYAAALTAGLHAKSQIKQSPWLWRLASAIRRHGPQILSSLALLAAGGGAVAFFEL